MAAICLLSIFLCCFSFLNFIVTVDGCQRHSEILAITEDVVTLPCSYDKLNSENVSLTPTWLLLSADLANTTTITFGTDIPLEYQKRYDVTDSRRNMKYNLQISTGSAHPTLLYVCGLSNGDSVTDLYDGYSFTVLQRPNCSRVLRLTDKQVSLNCSWNPSILSLPILVSWVRIRHPDVLDEESIKQATELNTATNSSHCQFMLSPEHYGDTFACVARTETSNNTAIGCSYVPLPQPDVTIMQFDDAVVGENVLFVCNASGLITNDVVYTWSVNNISVMELHRFELITDTVLKIRSIQKIDNGLNIKCNVAEGNIVHNAEFLLAVQYHKNHVTLSRPAVAGISAASCVVVVAVIMLVLIIKRLHNSKSKDDLATDVTAEQATNEGDAYMELEYSRTSPTYESFRTDGQQKIAANRTPPKGNRPTKTKDGVASDAKPAQATNEGADISNDYQNLDYSHAPPKYESIRTGTQSKPTDGTPPKGNRPRPTKTETKTKDNVVSDAEQEMNEGADISNEYQDLDYSHVPPNYESIRMGTQPRIADDEAESKDNQCYVNQNPDQNADNSNTYTYDYAVSSNQKE